MNKEVSMLKNNGVGVMPTDTIYGLVGSALSEKAVERIYRLRKRDLKKPMIVLIAKIEDLKIFNIDLDENSSSLLKKYWPGRVSIVLPCADEKLNYLHRGTKTLAFRLPDDKNLIELLKMTGPLVAPSANIEGEKPAETIEEAKKYFGKNVDFYIDGGKIKSKPSKLIAIDKGKVKVLRK